MPGHTTTVVLVVKLNAADLNVCVSNISLNLRTVVKSWLVRRQVQTQHRMATRIQRGIYIYIYIPVLYIHNMPKL